MEKGRSMRDGSFQRRFTNGLVVHNPPGNRQVDIVFDPLSKAVSTGALGKRFAVSPGDGDIFLRTSR
jgi:hypothetical protein